MSKGHAVLRALRKLHLWVGMFTTPALIFFAVTGAMQTFSLHETTPGSSYKPPRWIATLAQLHKKQTTVVPVRRPRPAAGVEGTAGSRGLSEANGAGASPPAQPAGQAKLSPGEPAAQSAQKKHWPLKIFFLLVSMSLMVSTLTGIYMSYRYSRNWWLLSGLLAAGVALPLVLLPF
jgi:hypothetical protein